VWFDGILVTFPFIDTHLFRVVLFFMRLSNKHLWIPCLIALSAALLFLSGCAGEDSSKLEREELFSIPVGKTENALNLIEVDRQPFTQRIRLVMKDGFIYISNGSSRKIMQFNSYGDLISLLYNPEYNPLPVLLNQSKEENTVTSKNAFTYPFRTVGEFCLTPDNTLLIEDEVLEERRVYDEELDTMLDRIVLRINREGELEDYIGQEGVGGTPFPYIHDLQITENGEIVVLCRTMKSWLLYWYTPRGSLIFQISILYDKLPVPEGLKVIPALETIHADRDARRLYLKLDYYHTQNGETGGEDVMSGSFEKSRIYILDIESGTYENFIELPRYFRESEEFNLVRDEKEEALYEFIGTAAGGYLYLLSPDQNNANELLILDETGRLVTRKTIIIQEDELVYRDFHIAGDGILSALLCEKETCRIVWWRCDKILEADRDEG